MANGYSIAAFFSFHILVSFRFVVMSAVNIVCIVVIMY